MPLPLCRLLLLLPLLLRLTPLAVLHALPLRCCRVLISRRRTRVKVEASGHNLLEAEPPVEEEPVHPQIVRKIEDAAADEKRDEPVELEAHKEEARGDEEREAQRKEQEENS